MACILGFLLGIALGPLLEYAWHAWVAHGRSGGGKVPSRKDHLDHHRTAYTVEPPWQEIRRNIVLVLVVDAAVCVPLGAATNAAFGVGLSLALGLSYVAITIAHARMHERAPRTRGEEWMWRFHWHHHAVDPRVNHGLTNPLFDYVFGTAVVPETVMIPSWMKPPWLDGEIAGIRVGRSVPSARDSK